MCTGDRAEEREAQRLEIIIRSVRNATCQDRAVRLDRREPQLALQEFAGTESPVVSERFLELGYHEPGDTKVQVLDRMAGVPLETVLVMDIDAAGEADPAVHHQDLPVVSQI